MHVTIGPALHATGIHGLLPCIVTLGFRTVLLLSSAMYATAM